MWFNFSTFGHSFLFTFMVLLKKYFRTFCSLNRATSRLDYFTERDFGLILNLFFRFYPCSKPTRFQVQSKPVIKNLLRISQICLLSSRVLIVIDCIITGHDCTEA